MRRLSYAAALAVLVAAACTPSSSEPPNPTLTPAIPTPAEGSFERQQRLDFEAAEKSYREFQAELREVLQDGGAKNLTPVLAQKTGGEFKKETTQVVQDFYAQGRRQTGQQRIVSVQPVEHGEALVVLDVCEDGRRVITYDRNGKSLGHNDLRRSKITVREADGDWRLTSADGQKVESCD